MINRPHIISFYSVNASLHNYALTGYSVVVHNKTVTPSHKATVNEHQLSNATATVVVVDDKVSY